ncbi:PH domain-containing protein [Chitinophaga pinensis]|uniref:Uncharacterized protein YyaB-like PH domain-containing protein n=1 Tax=Chitinophaga pinensis (strain ATCC 43595 / DSM 2588 / LMG 13176 / NBRC 15968 / NCIMB 11800 / UQM 2034) TaxID=485918 RepID=A0A979GUE2_CHIPD|nr:PH domain-containing protein [Chitinophaga pinensis]ACU60724.1 protein of unknown function DUF1200 [Chitinophaga pinensis DSM 2588]
MITYKSAVSAGIIVPVIIIFSIVLITAVISHTWGLLAFILLTSAFAFYTIFSVVYQLEGDELTIRCGILFKRTLSVQSIRSIRPTRNPLSAPAASLDRLEIAFNKFDTILVSPKDKEAFIGQLRAVNPNIEYLEKRR